MAHYGDQIKAEEVSESFCTIAGTFLPASCVVRGHLVDHVANRGYEEVHDPELCLATCMKPILLEFGTPCCPRVVLVMDRHLFCITSSLKCFFKDSAASIRIFPESCPLILRLVINVIVESPFRVPCDSTVKRRF